MSPRRGATRRRGRLPARKVPVHVPRRNPDVPGTCTCGLPLGVPNARHVDQLPETPPEVAAFEARRLGEHLEDEDA